MRAGGQYHYFISNSLTLVHVKTIITTLPDCVTTMICTQEHHRLARHAERRTRVNAEMLCAGNSACAVFPQTSSSPGTSSADVNNEVGCLGSGCLQRRRAGDEKQ